MKKSIVEAIESELGRRNFLRRAALVTGAFVTGLLIPPRQASAKPDWGCCQLCYPIVGSCTWPPNCACVWCWLCEETNDCFYWRCYECLMSFQFGCTPGMCKCHDSDVEDACRQCGPAVVCSAYDRRGKIPGCIPP